jgi:pseudouridine-5'-phosphate glycosidase
MSLPLLDVHPTIAAALRDRRAVVALESTLIAHGLPWPVNVETARAAEAAVRAAGAVPATIAVLDGRPTIGLDEEQIAMLGKPGILIRKASRRDLSAAIAQRASAATTVSATMFLAHQAGIRVFATGGIGGVHPSTSSGTSFDVSADLHELARTPVAVVCAGAKSILDLPATLEVLETQGVPVVGFGTDTFPAFYLRTSDLPVSVRVDSPAEAATLLSVHWRLSGAGVVLAQPLPQSVALDPEFFAQALKRAETMAHAAGVKGSALTPYLLARLAEITEGRTLRANSELIVANTRLAAAVALALSPSGAAPDRADRFGPRSERCGE